MAERTARDVCRSWRPAVAGVSEVLQASFTDHVYPRHCHDTWTVLLVDAGAVHYRLDRHRRNADDGCVTVLPPFVAHDGRSARPGHGFRKRVLYLDTDMVDEGLVGAAVDRPTIDDPRLRQAVSQLHASLRAPDDLEPESRLALVVERVTAVLARTTGRHRHSSRAADALRAALDERWRQPLDLADLAAELGWHPTHLIRSFTRQFGLPPHRYVISRRLDEARRQLLDGVPPAQVATDAGFHDQAHLGRHFKAHVGTTPAGYRRVGDL